MNISDQPLANVECDRRPARAWWAPGNYLNLCRNCGESFIGDKRAGHCADCAYTDPEWKCTICGRIGPVGRCCGDDTREPVNKMAWLERKNELETLVKKAKDNELKWRHRLREYYGELEILKARLKGGAE